MWVMQGWLFFNNPSFWQPPQTKALFDAVPDERMIVLDLFCESAPVWNKTEAFHGKPWVWCIIQNFGGRVGLYGGLPQIAGESSTRRIAVPQRGKLARRRADHGRVRLQPGCLRFGDRHDLARDNCRTWTTGSATSCIVDMDAENESVSGAWQCLRRTVYQQPGYSGSVIFSRPTLQAQQADSLRTGPLGRGVRSAVGGIRRSGVRLTRISMTWCMRCGEALGDVARVAVPGCAGCLCRERPCRNCSRPRIAISN